MDSLFSLVPPAVLALCMGITFMAGVVKGAVGFGMPMIMISLLGSIVAPELALAGLIVPTLLANGWQALRQGVGEARRSLKAFRLFVSVGFVALLASAQLVRVIPVPVMLMLIGGPVVFFTGLQLLGWKPHVRGRPRLFEAAMGAFAGGVGGFSGTWGPPTVLYLTALDTPKSDAVRIQGVLYGLGSVALLIAHVGSGVMRAQTLPFSLVLCVPAMLGMVLGLWLHDRIDQQVFRRATLIVLLLAGLNLIRRAMMG